MGMETGTTQSDGTGGTSSSPCSSLMHVLCIQEIEESVDMDAKLHIHSKPDNCLSAVEVTSNHRVASRLIATNLEVLL